MRKIDKIYIPCCKRDLWLTRICVASIRYWYPTIPIFLVIDLTYGNFSTNDIQKYWDVALLSTKRKKMGWAFSKYEVFFLKNNERVLVIDPDTVFCGKVLEGLELLDDDFIVTGDIIDNPRSDLVKNIYYDIDELLKIDPEYVFPGFGINGGQMVLTCGKLSADDFANYIEWSEPPVVRNKNIFKCGDQGILNYVLVKKMQKKEISLRYYEFEIWAKGAEAEKLDLHKIQHGEGYPIILHWAGPKGIILSRFKRSDILNLYESYYYSRLKFGFVSRFLDAIKRYFWMHNVFCFIKNWLKRYGWVNDLYRFVKPRFLSRNFFIGKG